MAFTLDWLEDTTLPAPPDYLVALGAFALRYNQMEMLLYSFMRMYFDGDGEVCAQIFMALHNRARVNLITTLLQTETDAEVRNAIAYALECFDLCVENRSLLMHGFPPGGNEEDALVLLKSTSNKPTKLNTYRFELAEMQAATLELSRVHEFIIGLNFYLRARVKYPSRQIVLPPRPLAPRKLSLSQLKATPQADPPQPEPGQG